MTTATSGAPAWRAGLAGALAAFALTATALAALGFLGHAVANQTLLANTRAHAAMVGGALWLGVVLLGWRLIGSAGLAAAVGLLVATASLVEWTTVGQSSAATSRVEIATFNILAQNPEGARVADWLITAGPDVAVLQEAGPLRPHLDRLAEAYPHRLGCDVQDCDLAVLSRLPFVSAEILATPDGLRRAAAVRLDIGGGPFWVFAVHWPKSFLIGRGEHARTLFRVARRRALDMDAPFVVAGDFNAMPWDPNLRWLAERLQLRHPAAWRATWPVGLGPLGAQIDHVLAGPGVVFKRFGWIEDTFGSNHRGLRAQFAVGG